MCRRYLRASTGLYFKLPPLNMPNSKMTSNWQFLNLFFRMIGYGLGFLLIILGITFFGLMFSCKLHTLQEKPPISSKSLIFAFSSVKLFATLAMIMLLSFEFFSSNNNTTLNYFRLLFVMALIYIIMPKYVLISQNDNLKFYFKVYHHQPPPVLPWQLPKNYSTSVNLVVLSYENK